MKPTTDRTPTPSSGALSLLDLRRHLLRRASALAVRARVLRQRGDTAGAARLGQEAVRLFNVAREMARTCDPR